MTISGIWGVRLLLRHPRRRRLFRQCDTATGEVKQLWSILHTLWSSENLEEIVEESFHASSRCLCFEASMWSDFTGNLICLIHMRFNRLNHRKFQEWCQTPPLQGIIGYHHPPPQHCLRFRCSPRGLGKICSGQRPALPLLVVKLAVWWLRQVLNSWMQKECISENWVDIAKMLHVFVFVIEPQIT